MREPETPAYVRTEQLDATLVPPAVVPHWDRVLRTSRLTMRIATALGDASGSSGCYRYHSSVAATGLQRLFLWDLLHQAYYPRGGVTRRNRNGNRPALKHPFAHAAALWQPKLSFPVLQVIVL
jgi:hypothetical protein